MVTMMKGMAAMHIRHYERAVESLRDFNQYIELGFQALFQRRPGMLPRVIEERTAPALTVVFGSDQGMCGPLNNEIVQYAMGQLEALKIGRDERIWLAIGVRAAAELTSRGCTVEAHFTAPSSVAALADHAQNLLVRIEELRRSRNVGAVLLMYHRQTRKIQYRPRNIQLLPLNRAWLIDLARRPWPTNHLPDFRVSWDALFRSLLRNRLFAVLFQALAESGASENAKRLASMQAAEKNIEERIDNLRMNYHRRRQAGITEELLDVVSGYEVAKGGR